MTTASFAAGDVDDAKDLELSLSDRVALAASTPRHHVDVDGSLVIELDVYPLDARTALPTPSFRKTFLPRLRRALTGGRNDSRSVRYIPRGR